MRFRRERSFLFLASHFKNPDSYRFVRGTPAEIFATPLTLTACCNCLLLTIYLSLTIYQLTSYHVAYPSPFTMDDSRQPTTGLPVCYPDDTFYHRVSR